MSCTFCKNKDSRLAAHHMCNCCLVHLECCEATAENELATRTKRVILDDTDEVEPVECDICLKEYLHDELEEHQETCMPRTILRCIICSGDYMIKESLWNHLVGHEITDPNKESYFEELTVTYELHKCALCNDYRGYSESAYWNHIHEDHDGYFLRCLECMENFRSERHMNEHALNHDKESKQSDPAPNNQWSSMPLQRQKFVRPKCVLCKRFFTKLANYKYHMLTYHSDPKHQCPQCSQKFHLEDTLQRHLNLHAEKKSEPSESGECNSVVAEGIDPNATNDPEKNESQRILSTNTDALDESSSLRCPHCCKGFFKENSLDYHIVRFHKLITCDLCGASIRGKYLLRYHKLTCHTKPQYKCRNCPKQFHLIVSYRRHMLWHLNERNLSCHSCRKIFKSTHHFDLHTQQNSCEKKVHDESELCDTKCPHCYKQCYHAKYVVRHVENIHRPIPCDLCKEIFIGKNQLLWHRFRTHLKLKYVAPCVRSKFRKKKRKHGTKETTSLLKHDAMDITERDSS